MLLWTEVQVNRINNILKMDTIIASASSTSQQFCAFCLSEKFPTVEFHEHIVGCSVEQQKYFQSILGYAFRLHNFAICKPCWKMVQLIQDFQLRCLKANSLLDRIGRGVKSEAGWFSMQNLAIIESIRMMVKDQLQQMEQLEVEAEKVRESDQPLSGTQEPAEEDLVSMLSIGEVKVELDGADSDKEVMGSSTEVLKTVTDQEIPMVALHNVQIKCEPDAENNNQHDYNAKAPEIAYNNKEPEVVTEQPSSTRVMVTESSDKDSIAAETNIQQLNRITRASKNKILGLSPSISVVKPEVQHTEQPFKKRKTKSKRKTNTSNLQQCMKCSRLFRKASYKFHIQNCDGTIPDRIFECPDCPLTFTHRYKFNAHVNKHTGKHPFKCRGNCKKGFASASTRYRHETKCVKGPIKCTLCDKMVENPAHLSKHYRREHPEKCKFKCSNCDKEFSRRDKFKRHGKKCTPKKFPCPVCNKCFTQKSNMTKHMLIHTERELISCEHCDRKFMIPVSLELHMAVKHPDLASERAKEILIRHKEIYGKKRKESKVLKKRGGKPKKKKVSDSETEISEDKE